MFRATGILLLLSASWLSGQAGIGVDIVGGTVYVGVHGLMSSTGIGQTGIYLGTGMTVNFTVNSSGCGFLTTDHRVWTLGTLTITAPTGYLEGLPYGSQFHLIHADLGVVGFSDPLQRFLVWPALPLGWYVLYNPNDIYLIHSSIRHKVTLR
jgi:hypothetical protein